MTTRIVAVRHGNAESAGYASDDLRPLSPEGREIQGFMTQRLRNEGVIPTRIFSSPLLRAIQTAEIIGAVFGIPVEVEEALGNDFNEEALVERLASHKGLTVVLVGHAPTLAEFVNVLVDHCALKPKLPPILSLAPVI